MQPQLTGSRKPRRAEVLAGALDAVGPDRRWLGLGVVLSCATGILETVLLYIIARVGVALSSGESTVQVGVGPIQPRSLRIVDSVWVATGVVITLLVLAPAVASVFASISRRVIVRSRATAIEAYMNSTWAYRSTEREGHLAMIVGDYCSRVEAAVNQLSTVIVAACAIFFVAVGAVLTSPLASLGGVLGFAVLFGVVRPLSRRVKASGLRNVEVNGEVVARVAETARMGIEITAFDVGNEVSAALREDVGDAAAALRSVRYSSRLAPNIFQYGALFVILVMVGVLSGTAPERLAALAPLILLMVRALTYLRQLLTASQALLEFAPYVREVQSELEDLRRHAATDGGLTIATFEGLAFEDVTFSYISGAPVIRSASFGVEAGQVVGIVGPSGGGKTTLIQLLLRLQKPDTGRITSGGVDLSLIDRHSWARLAAYVPQDNKLIFGSVADNIRFFRPGYSADAVVAAATAAHLHDDIVKLPQGYDTKIGPGARSLSGGQSQRLGIARALLTGAPLLVLDEPTSALDTTSEALIRTTLEELKGSVTVILIAHRPATLEACDRVLRVEGGAVREESSAPRAL